MTVDLISPQASPYDVQGDSCVVNLFHADGTPVTNR